MNKSSALLVMILTSLPIVAQAAPVPFQANEEVIVTTTLEAVR